MFFSTELLSRRDSGFGLLWLAATLGAKSSFKKLPRRSVLTADISQLCGLIAEPEEPLALRLSSNLMVGVVRVYKVKQEILLTDATVCFNTLKKAVSEMHVAGAAGDFQMGQPTVRPDTVTVATDPTVALLMDFEQIFQPWENRQRRDREANDNEEEGSDEEFDPSGKKRKRKARAKGSSISTVEEPRLDAHTLKENHELLFSGSFDRSLHDSVPGGFVSSSSQFGGFGFDDNFMDVGDIGDELARELGEGWGGVSTPKYKAPIQGNDGDVNIEGLGGIEELGDQGFDLNHVDDLADIGSGIPDDAFHVQSSRQNSVQRGASALNDGVFHPEGSIILPLSPLNPSPRPSDKAEGDELNAKQSRRPKRVRLLLDARTELTNEELERARANYIEGQTLLKRELEKKKAEKESGRMFEEMLWGAPHGISAPALMDFWLENFRLQVKARSGQLHVEAYGQPPTKRRKVDEAGTWEGDEAGGDVFSRKQVDDIGVTNTGGDFGTAMDDQYMGGDMPGAGGDFANFEAEPRLRSSEEPGTARRASRPPSLSGIQLDFGLPPAQELNLSSQKSNLFPWDHAGASSSVSGVGFVAAGSDRISVGHGGSRKRGSSSHRDSPLPLGVADSPASFGFRGSQLDADVGFEFDLPGEHAAADESQRSDASVLTLEKNSFNFLEYAKMQLQAFPSATSSIQFDDIVPKDASTRHVAAAAFYHCLVLATKDLLGVKQDSPYGNIAITDRVGWDDEAGVAERDWLLV
ncbi:hypothetical protein NM688_g4549 [Phlebia brevispora]|uniref:Uncharacterized protein n=1 Tax=Phlebia brevispora TaxID=194682 RepID=A0ACC1T2S8_9APHY|nr:hypothetical protein NM688_g4549 [Phlebia brevispora]